MLLYISSGSLKTENQGKISNKSFSWGSDNLWVKGSQRIIYWIHNSQKIKSSNYVSRKYTCTDVRPSCNLIGHTIGFWPQSQKLELHNYPPSFTPGMKRLIIRINFNIILINNFFEPPHNGPKSSHSWELRFWPTAKSIILLAEFCHTPAQYIRHAFSFGLRWSFSFLSIIVSGFSIQQKIKKRQIRKNIWERVKGL